MNFLWGVDPEKADNATKRLGDFQTPEGAKNPLGYPGDTSTRPLTDREEEELKRLNERHTRETKKVQVMNSANANLGEQKQASRVHGFLDKKKSPSMPPPEPVDIINVVVKDPIQRTVIGRFKLEKPWTTENLMDGIRQMSGVGHARIFAHLDGEEIIGSLTPGSVTPNTKIQELSEMSLKPGRKEIQVTAKRGGKRHKTKRTRRKRRRKTKKNKRSKRRRGKKRKTRKRRKKRR